MPTSINIHQVAKMAVDTVRILPQVGVPCRTLRVTAKDGNITEIVLFGTLNNTDLQIVEE